MKIQNPKFKIQKLTIVLLFALCTLLSAQEQKIILRFSEPMDKQTLLLKSNYNLFDESMNAITINKVGVVQGDTAVIIFTNFLNYKTNFVVRVQNVKDKAGNLINQQNSAWFYCDGYNPQEPKPYLVIKK